ncbi:methylmalonyl-CoA mutase family protein [Alteribacillus iranensis]|uniref:Methylmalonyl-CoA mutase n=1 Tax=Alteribacillus iranensis TaxID=930128 RepID=A0A1I2CWD9_9BACI|nr:methylmalonyl-CoA mutase family protein [Alteribacillus iranensis]SFE72073.1 methylmalonyl-CoA mutase [Alteribacillus iranensis]
MKDELQSVLADICNFPVPSEEEWYQAAEKSLKGKSVEKLLYTTTPEGITLKPLYVEKDREELPYTDNIPGQAPHLRGVGVLPDDKKAWHITQAVTERTPEAANKEINTGLKKGQHGVTIRLNAPVLQGKKPASDNISESGVLVVDVEDVKTLFNKVDWENHTLHMEAGPDILPIFSILAGSLQSREELTKIEGSVAADPLGSWVKHGSLPVSLTKSFDNMAAVIKWSQQQQVNLRTVLVSSEPYHNGGASAVEEIAYTLAAGVTYLRELQQRGVSPEESAPFFQFSFPAGASFFMEIAKFRAARALWSNIQAAFDIEEEKRTMHVHGTTSQRTKAKYDPYVNMLRSTTEAFAAAAGGADSIEVAPFDEAFQRPTDFSKRIARNTQIILQEEAHIGRTIDAGGGSFYIEQLSDELAQKAWSLFQEIEAEGGLVTSLEKGTPQAQVEEKKKDRERDVQKQKRVFVGVNKYADLDEKPISVLPEDDSQEVSNYLQKRENSLSRAQRNYDEDNIVESTIQAAEEGASIQDIAAGLGWAASEEKQIPNIPLWREAEVFEELRDKANTYKEEKGKSLSALLVTLGPLASHKARTDFASGFLQTGGFETVQTEDLLDTETAVEKAASTEESILVLCGTDQSYEEQAADIVEGVKKQTPDKTILLAGNLSDEENQQLSERGLDGTIHRHSNVYETLSWLHRVKGAESK